MSDQTVRHHIHDAIQASASMDDSDPDDNLEGAILIGWVCVAEWMHPTGNKWLSRLSGNATNDNPACSWQMQGYLHNALHDWPEGEAE